VRLGFTAMRRHVLGSVVALVLGAGSSGCTSSQTSTAVAAPSVKCQVQVGSATTAFTADGGQGTLAVATTRDCTWSVSTNANWVSVANTNGQGEASVPYTVAANPVPASRAAEINVSDATLQLNQAAAPCRFTLSPAAGSMSSAGGTLTAQLATLTGCAWTATTDAPWLTVVAGGSGNASAAITMSVAANSGAARSAHMIAAGLTSFTVNQSAGGTAPPPTPTQTVQLTGTVSGLSGSCPTLSFVLSSRSVFTIGSTSFSHGKCKDLGNGDSVTVIGTVQADGRVLATFIDVGN
jgi:hypothetical protein